jgi:hypothetical protein
LSSITPDTGPANTDVTIDVAGTDFDPGAMTVFGNAFIYPAVPATPTDMSVDVGALNLQFPGTLQVKVRNSDGTDSNALPFTAT